MKSERHSFNVDIYKLEDQPVFDDCMIILFSENKIFFCFKYSAF